MSEALQNALTAIDDYPGDGSDRDLLIRAKCRGLMRGYHERWKDAGYEVLSVEKTYHAPLYNPDSLKPSRTFTMAGKVDVLARLHGRTYVIDHKTTSESIEDPNAPYWQQLAIDGQVSQYLYLMWLEGIKPDGAVWDVIRKPKLLPRELKAGEVASVVSEGVWCGMPVDYETRMAFSGKQTKRETLPMYEARLAKDCTKDRPERYFQRQPVPRLDNDLIEYARDLWQVGQTILRSRKKQERLVKSTGACLNFHSPCKFLGICSGHDTPDSGKWQRKEFRHGELEMDHDAITNSRAKCYQLCPVKHYYEYELAIERFDEEEKEALFFGSVFHAGQESYWKSFLIEESDDGNSETSQSANGVGRHSAATT